MEAFKTNEKTLAMSAEYVASPVGLRFTVLLSRCFSLVNATAGQEARLVQRFRYLL